MLIQIDEMTYAGTGTQIIDQLRNEVFNPFDYPDTESFIRQLQSNLIRVMELECDLPKGDTENRARAMLYFLAKVGALELLEDDDDAE